MACVCVCVCVCVCLGGLFITTRHSQCRLHPPIVQGNHWLETVSDEEMVADEDYLDHGMGET